MEQVKPDDSELNRRAWRIGTRVVALWVISFGLGYKQHKVVLAKRINERSASVLEQVQDLGDQLQDPNLDWQTRKRLVLKTALLTEQFNGLMASYELNSGRPYERVEPPEVPLD